MMVFKTEFHVMVTVPELEAMRSKKYTGNTSCGLINLNLLPVTGFGYQ